MGTWVGTPEMTEKLTRKRSSSSFGPLEITPTGGKIRKGSRGDGANVRAVTKRLAMTPGGVNETDHEYCGEEDCSRERPCSKCQSFNRQNRRNARNRASAIRKAETKNQKKAKLLGLTLDPLPDDKVERTRAIKLRSKQVQRAEVDNDTVNMKRRELREHMCRRQMRVGISHREIAREAHEEFEWQYEEPEADPHAAEKRRDFYLSSALDQFRRAAALNCADAHFQLSDIFVRQECGVESSADEVLLHLKCAADLGLVDAHFYLGAIYAFGKVFKDVPEQKQKEECLSALKRGNYSKLGLPFENTGLAFKKDAHLGVRHFLLAAAGGHAEAAFVLGYIRSEQFHIRSQAEKAEMAAMALENFSQAAEAGHWRAALRLGAIFEKGELDSTVDMERAATYYGIAARNGAVAHWLPNSILLEIGWGSSPPPVAAMLEQIEREDQENTAILKRFGFLSSGGEALVGFDRRTFSTPAPPGFTYVVKNDIGQSVGLYKSSGRESTWEIDRRTFTRQITPKLQEAGVSRQRSGYAVADTKTWRREQFLGDGGHPLMFHDVLRAGGITESSYYRSGSSSEMRQFYLGGNLLKTKEFQQVDAPLIERHHNWCTTKRCRWKRFEPYRFTVENGLVDSLYETWRRLRNLRREVEKWMPMTKSAAAAERSKRRYVAPSLRWSVNSEPEIRSYKERPAWLRNRLRMPNTS